MTRQRAGHAKRGFGRYSPPTRGRGAHAVQRSGRDAIWTRHAATLVGTGLLATTGVLGLGALSSSPSGAVTCAGGSASDGLGNACTSGANAFSDAGELQNDSADPLLDITGSQSVSVDLIQAASLYIPATPTATDNGAKAEGTGAVAVAGADQTSDEFVDATVSGNDNNVTLSETSSNTADGAFSASGNEATADGTGAVAVAGSNQTNVLSESVTTPGDDNTADASLNVSNTFTGSFTADNDVASATGEYAEAVAGSNQTDISDIAITQGGNNNFAIYSGTNVESATDNVTTDGDTAIADGTFATATAGSNNTSTTDGSAVTADDDTAIASGAGAYASAGSGILSSGDVTQNDDTAIALGVDGGQAYSSANGTGVTVLTLAIGPTASAFGSESAATTSAGAGEFALALSSTGYFSISVNGTTI
jgi:trimeric autotransporter adhesin